MYPTVDLGLAPPVYEFRKRIIEARGLVNAKAKRDQAWAGVAKLPENVKARIRRGVNALPVGKVAAVLERVLKAFRGDPTPGRAYRLKLLRDRMRAIQAAKREREAVPPAPDVDTEMPDMPPMEEPEPDRPAITAAGIPLPLILGAGIALAFLPRILKGS